MRKIAVLGSTGVVGRRALEVMEHLGERPEVLAAGQNIVLLEEQIKRHLPRFVVVFDRKKAAELAKRVDVEVLAGQEGLLAAVESVDVALFAMSGTEGMAAALRGAKLGKRLLLASKEIVVAAGELLRGADILPLDSEHASLFQCMKGEAGVEKVYLTATGGPFLRWKEQDLGKVRVAEALQHPHWSMGHKSAVDSSTLMNKGLEMIEAKYLFDLRSDQIGALIHPEAVVQSMVCFADGYVRAQGAPCDMAHSIQWALEYPNRTRGIGGAVSFDVPFRWSFEMPDTSKFRCLHLAQEALRLGESYPCFLNSANEALVQRFLQGEIGWVEIGEKLEQLISSHKSFPVIDLGAILHIEVESKQLALNA